jgi:hypothetical protein
VNASRILNAVDIRQHGARPDPLQGTLDLLILRTLRTGSMHGWAISERILIRNPLFATALACVDSLRRYPFLCVSGSIGRFYVGE